MMRRALALLLAAMVWGMSGCAGEGEAPAENKSEQTSAGTVASGVKPGEWTMDLEAAKAVAAERDLPILLWFTGSDWCGYCQAMERDVFAREEWEEYAAETLILVSLDFPRFTKLEPAEYRARNERLKSKYEVEGLPTFVVLDSDGKTVLSKFGVSEPIEPFSFIKSVGAARRARAKERDALLGSLGEKEAAAYKASLVSLTAAESEFNAWLASRPQRTPENEVRFNDYMKRIPVLKAQLEKRELEGAVRALARQQAAGDLAVLAQAAETLEKLEALRSARDDLANWLLGMPPVTDQTRKRYLALKRALDERVRALRGE